jgi:small-conductance mechanosensitive channel
MPMPFIPFYPADRILRRWMKVVPFLMVFLFPGVLPGQIGSDVDPEQLKDEAFRAPVNVDGYELFHVRGVSSYPAISRAKTIESRIKKVALNPRINVDSIKMLTFEDRIMIVAGQQLLVNIYQEDADIEAASKEVLAELVYSKIKESIQRYRYERTPAFLNASMRKALLASGLLILSLGIFIFIFRKLNLWFKSRIKSKIDKLENVSFKLIQSEQLLAILHFLYRVVRLVVILFITLFFVDYVLGLFPRTRQMAKYIFDLLVSPLEKMALSFVEALPSLVFLLLIFVLTQYLIRLIRLFFHGIDLGEIRIANFDAEWAMPTFRIVKLLVIIFALVIAYPYIPGSSSSAFQGISVFLGVLFSLGSSSFIANIIAGYSMTYRRAFKMGDRIQVDDFMGFVLEQTLMVTRLRSVKNEEIIIPNSTLLNSNIKNYTQAAKERGIILHTSVGIGYETPWRLVESMLLEAASRTKGLLKDPPPYVLQKGLGDFSVTYEVNAYCDDPINMYFMYTDLHRNILDVFNENNIQIMTPAYEGDPEIPKVVPKEQWNTPLANSINQNSNT